MGIRDEVGKYLGSYSHRPIRDGKSGAEVWELNGSYVLKYVQREKLAYPEQFLTYQNEARFYHYFHEEKQENRLPCLPDVGNVQMSDQEILIVLKKYERLSKEQVDERLLRRIMRALALIHTQELPGFLTDRSNEPGYLEKEQIAEAVAGWRSVLAEHPGVFNEEILEQAAKRINPIIAWHYQEPQVLSHGDFHWDNLLLGKDGEVLVCDWQGVNAGGASGDISFFLSRLGADGIELAPEQLVKLYVQERILLAGEAPAESELLLHMEAANLITTFQFWHQYLHGSTDSRVRGLYEKMKFPDGLL